MTHGTRRPLLIAGLAACLLPAAHPVHAASYTYTLSLFAAPPGDRFIFAEGVNDSGQVAGYASSGTGVTQAFLSAPNGGALQYPQPQNIFTNESLGVNDAGQVTGYTVNNNGHADAFLTGPNGGTLTDLGALSGDNVSQGDAVNASGQVAGFSYSSGILNAPNHAFVSGPNGGSLMALGTLPGDNSSQATGINASGEAVGNSNVIKVGSLALGGPTHAFFYTPGVGLASLGTLPGGSVSRANGINASGQVAGSSGPSNTQQHAFLSAANGGALTDLGVLPGGSFSSGLGINDLGQAVGLSDTSVGAGNGFMVDAFLYTPGVGMVDLNSLIAPGSGVRLEGARSISNDGFIVGNAVDSQENGYVFLLTPHAPGPPTAAVPEASPLSLLAFGVLLTLGGLPRARQRA